MSDPDASLPSTLDLRTVFEQVRDVALFVGSEPGTIDHVSSEFEALYGVSSEAVTADASALFDRVPEADRERVAEFYDTAPAAGERTRFEHRVRDADGEERWVRAHVTTVADERRGEDVTVGLVVDVTDEKRREEELVVLNRLLRHDVRNDMAVIDGWLDQLRVESERTQSILDRVHSASEQVLELTEISHEVLEVTLKGGKSDLKPMALTTMVETILREKRELHPEVAFELVGSPPEMTVAANALLSTIVRNLLQNAVVHNDAADPEVGVELEADETAARLRVSDNGSGVHPDVRDELFDMGVKGPGSRGTGLGLYLCRRVVETYDGAIRYDPTAAEGAAFVVEIPLAEA